MRKFFIIIGIIICKIGLVSGQNLEIHSSLGSFSIPNGKRVEAPTSGSNVNLGFYYQLNKHWSIGIDLNRSSNNYYRESMAGFQLPLEGTIISDHFSFLINKKITLPHSIILEGGIGLGIFVDMENYFMPVYYDEDEQDYRGVYNVDEYSKGITFPAQFSVRKEFSNKVSIGIEAGAFYDQFLNNRGLYFGPRVSYYL
ncbi:hypothetical protein [uncultured Cyclobacterium sp.]|uniref:hypothetical protein n=1 Tax=uncultured Cyclobacterium sp. TaxID=453820 RepID=UPI0030ED9EFD|tara:strand:+ start:33104 stop:33697 length:594 start_codon:yes stop_codon:yes gene_type:complete